jgi:hypothetical protein
LEWLGRASQQIVEPSRQALQGLVISGEIFFSHDDEEGIILGNVEAILEKGGVSALKYSYAHR